MTKPDRYTVTGAARYGWRVLDMERGAFLPCVPTLAEAERQADELNRASREMGA